jgi:hypothetical protein
MRGAIPLLLQYASMAWCSVKAQGQLYFYLYLTHDPYNMVVTEPLYIYIYDIISVKVNQASVEKYLPYADIYD